MPEPTLPQARYDNVQSGLYKNYNNDLVYEQVGGVLELPCSDGSPMGIPVFTGYTRKRQRFSAIKDVTPPLVPAPRPDGLLGDGTNLNSTYLGGSITMPLPQLAGQAPQQFQYSVAGEYVYLLSGTVDASTGLPGGKYPFQFPIIDAVAAKLLPTDKSPLTKTIDPDVMQAGSYSWYWPTVSSSFFDPNLS